MQNDTNITYYAEHTDSPDTWSSPRPAFDVEKFNRKLEQTGGLVGSVPRFRLRWAGEIDEYALEEWQNHIGYLYRENGVEKYVSKDDVDFEFPEGAIWAPRFETIKNYIPRWVVEEYTEPFYTKCWYVEELRRLESKAGRVEWLSSYREPGARDLEWAAGKRYKDETLTTTDIAAGLEREAAYAAKLKTDESAAIRTEMVAAGEKKFKDGVTGATLISIPPHPALKNIIEKGAQV